MAFECKHSQRWKKRVKHPQSYSFIFVLLNLPHAQKRKSELFRGEDSEFPEIKSSCHGYDYVRDQRMRTVIEGEKAPSFYHWLPLQNVCWCVNIVCETFKGVFSRVKHSRHLCCFHRQQGLAEWAAGGGSAFSVRSLPLIAARAPPGLTVGSGICTMLCALLWMLIRLETQILKPLSGSIPLLTSQRQIQQIWPLPLCHWKESPHLHQTVLHRLSWGSGKTKGCIHMVCARAHMHAHTHTHTCEESSSIAVYIKLMSLHQAGFLLLCVDSCAHPFIHPFIKHIPVASWCEWEPHWEPSCR